MTINPFNLIGVGVLIISIMIIRKGILIKGTPGPGQFINNIKVVGAGVILGIMAIAMCFTSKSVCEVFGFFC